MSVNLTEDFENVRKSVDLLLNDKLIECENLLTGYDEKTLFSALGLCVLKYSKFILSLEDDILDDTMKTVFNIRTLSQSCRRNTGFFSSMFHSTEYTEYTEYELIAEIVFHFTSLMETILLIISQGNFKDLIKCGINFFKARKTLSQLYHLMNNPNECKLSSVFKDPFVYNTFKMLITYLSGMFKVILSLIPEKYLKFLSIVGINGNMDSGFNNIKKAAVSDSIVSTFASLTYGTLIVTIEQNMHIRLTSDDQSHKIDQIIESNIKTSSLFKILHCRKLLLSGQFKKAINIYNDMIKKDFDWPELKNIIYWELFWSHCANGEFRLASEYSAKLFNSSNWSKALFTYFRSICIISSEIYEKINNNIKYSNIDAENFKVQLKSPCRASITLYSFGDESCFSYKSFIFDDNSREINAENYPISDLKNIDSLIKTLYGKRSIDEKHASKRSSKFVRNDYIASPIYEVLYNWNWFPYIAMNEECYEISMKNLEIEYFMMSFNQEKKFNKDRILIKFLIATLLAQKTCNLLQAKKLFKSILNTDVKRPGIYHFLICSTCYELALIYYQLKKYKKAIMQIHHSRKYDHYLIESRALFKISSLEKLIIHHKSNDNLVNIDNKITD